MEEPTNIKPTRASRFENKRLLMIGVVIIVQIALIASFFTLAYTLGKDVGRTEANITEGIQGFNTMLGSVSNPNRSTSGKVAEVSASTVVVENQRGVKKTVKLNDKTEITYKAEPAEVSSIKKGSTISVFFVDGSVETPTAERIIISRQ